MEAQPKKVLVVESDEVVRVLISHILERQSYTVDTVRNAAAAEQLLEHNSYDAMLVEVAAAAGGLTIIRRLAADEPALLRRIIVVTGALHEIPHLNGFNVHSVVKKPFDLYSLIDTVADCVARSKA